MKRLFPFLSWLEELGADTVKADLVAGLTVALVLIPQSMAYAQLAGLPPYYGLYAAFLPPLVAALFGSSRQLATGPVAVVSLMTAAALEPMATAGSSEYISYAILLALLVGLFQLALGILRLGLIVNFLSHPVVNGFTNAAALIIATSQLSKLFGVVVDKAERHYETVYRVILTATEYTHWPTVGMAVLAFVIMVVLKKLHPRAPNVLVAVVVTTALSWAVGYEKKAEVPAAALESPQARELIKEFNRTVSERQEIERLRAQGNRLFQEQAPLDVGKEVCINCHARRGTGFSWREGEATRSRSGKALALHHAAGLLDLRLSELKAQENRSRAALRRLRFRAMKAPEGELSFYLPGDLPQEAATAGDRWRLRVGNRPLDEEALIVTGGGAVVAHIPQGLPELGLPHVDWRKALQLFFVAIAISILGFMEAISIAKAMAARTHQRLDPDQELIGQGLANIVGCLGQSYAVSGSFSRSAVNLQAGARTGLSNAFSSCVVVVVLMFFTPLLYHLPQAVLAAIIMVAVFGLLNVGGFIHAWRAQKFDGLTGVASFVATLAFAPHLEWGIALGVALSLGAYLYRTMKPPVPELSLHPDGSLRDAQRHGLRRCRHIAAIRFDGPLNFANAGYLEDKVLELVADMPELRHVLIAAHGINEVDASGEDTLRLLVDRLRQAGYEVSFSGLKEKVVDSLMRTGLYERIGEHNMFPTQAHAVAGIYAKAHVSSTEKDCPLQSMKPRVMELSLHADGSLRDVGRYGLKRCRHIAVIRFEGSLDLASTTYLEEKVDARVRSMPELRFVLITSQGITQADARGAETLGRLIRRLRESRIRMCFSGFSDNLLDVLERFHLFPLIGRDRIYPTEIQAIRSIYENAHADSTERDCPLQALRPHVVELSLDADGSLRDAERWGLRTCRHIAALRFDGPLDVASATYLVKKVEECVRKEPLLKHVLFAAHRIHRIDAHGIATIEKLVRWLRDSGYEVSFSGLADDVVDALDKTGVYDVIGTSHIHPTQIQAVRRIYGAAHADSDEVDCPFTALKPLVAELALHRDGSLRDRRRWNLRRCEHIAALRFDGVLDEAGAEYLEEKVKGSVGSTVRLRHVFIACHRMSRVEERGAAVLVRIVQWARRAGLDVSFSGFSDDVLDDVKRSRLYEVIGEDHIYPTQAAAIESIHPRAHAGTEETVCPLLEVVYEGV